MKSLTGGVNFCRCEGINYFLDVCFDWLIFKNSVCLFFRFSRAETRFSRLKASIEEKQVSGIFEQYCRSR